MADGSRTRSSLLHPGVNCWQRTRADRVALLVDGEQYFAAFATAAARARRSILILAWDFNSQTFLRCDADTGQPQLPLGEFLNSLARRRRWLDVRILIWDYPMIFGADREFPPLYGLGWKPHRRVRLRYDNTHPVAGSHHQKVVVIDDRVAFCGGLDLTTRRWDTCAHRPGDERRKAGDVSYPPFHDVMMMVEGETARSLGALARERWRLATGRRIRPPRKHGDPWPADVEPRVSDATVAISRTLPPRNSHPAVREVEALYLEQIAAARRYIFIENQYFTSQKAGDALAARLAEPEGPEIIVVLRLLSHGWLEELTMQNLRRGLIDRLRQADRMAGRRRHSPPMTSASSRRRSRAALQRSRKSSSLSKRPAAPICGAPRRSWSRSTRRSTLNCPGSAPPTDWHYRPSQAQTARRCISVCSGCRATNSTANFSRRAVGRTSAPSSCSSAPGP